MEVDMDKDWLFVTDEYICDLRTVAVFIKNDKILVQRDRDGSEYALPGGHIKIGETLVHRFLINQTKILVYFFHSTNSKSLSVARYAYVF